MKRIAIELPVVMDLNIPKLEAIIGLPGHFDLREPGPPTLHVEDTPEMRAELRRRGFSMVSFGGNAEICVYGIYAVEHRYPIQVDAMGDEAPWHLMGPSDVYISWFDVARRLERLGPSSLYRAREL